MAPPNMCNHVGLFRGIRFICAMPTCCLSIPEPNMNGVSESNNSKVSRRRRLQQEVMPRIHSLCMYYRPISIHVVKLFDPFYIVLIWGAPIFANFNRHAFPLHFSLAVILDCCCPRRLLALEVARIDHHEGVTVVPRQGIVVYICLGQKVRIQVQVQGLGSQQCHNSNTRSREFSRT